MKKIFFFSSLFLGFTFSSCTPSSSDKNSASVNPVVTPAPETTLTNQAARDLEGSWVSICTSENNRTLSGVTQGETLTFSVSQRSGCTNSYFTLVYTYSISGGETANSASGAKNLNGVLTGFKIVPNDSVQAQNLNSVAACGFSDWSSGQAKDVLGVNCFGNTLAAGTPLYQIYSLNGSTLQIGDLPTANQGTTEQNRPTSLAADRLMKQ